MNIVEKILELFTRRGESAYHGEAVSQAEHALQAADLAEQEGAPDRLIVAALLHDVGHLLDGQDEDLAERGVDGRHEEAGGAWLARHFGPEVTAPIRLHVAAKRYLCAVDPSYLEGLSSASRLSLDVQGGPMKAEERARIRGQPVLSRRRAPAALGRYGQGARPGRPRPGALPRTARSRRGGRGRDFLIASG